MSGGRHWSDDSLLVCYTVLNRLPEPNCNSEDGGGKSLRNVRKEDAKVSQVYYLTFMCDSTCFGRLSAHHQEHATALEPLVVPLETGCWSVVGRGLPDHDQQRSNSLSLTVLPEAQVQLYAPDDGRKGARNMLSHT